MQAMHNNCIINNKTLWFILINTVFATHMLSVRLYSKHLKENKIV